jgi:hypothetical protein
VNVSTQEGSGAKSLVMVPRLKEDIISDLVSVLAAIGKSVGRSGYLGNEGGDIEGEVHKADIVENAPLPTYAHVTRHGLDSAENWATPRVIECAEAQLTI